MIENLYITYIIYKYLFNLVIREYEPENKLIRPIYCICLFAFMLSLSELNRENRLFLKSVRETTRIVKGDK